jgi:hypothetical protein
VVLQAIEQSEEKLPQVHDWYVFGRIAEGYGEKVAAAELYRRVVDADLEEEGRFFTTAELARRRLAALATSP